MFFFLNSDNLYPCFKETKLKLRKECLSYSPIWNRDLIKELNKNKVSTHEINKLRAKYLMPGSDINMGANEAKIPILIIQTTSETNFNHIKNGTMFTGWDIIIPNNWAMPFWQLLIHLGARAVGLNEMNYLSFQAGKTTYKIYFYL